MKKINGITLIELLVTIFVLSILVSVAVPSFLDSLRKQKLISAAEQMYSFVQQARSESLARSEPIFVNLASLNTSSWSYGMKGEACNPTITSNTDSAACVLVVDDGDGVFNAAADSVIHRVDGSEHDNINLSLKNGSGSTAQIVFDPARGTVDASQDFKFYNQQQQSVVVRVNKLGIVKICSDDYAEYKSCNA
ncbi:GspH/FimT family pseudopilin [Thalassotalea ponticola]|uniref:GspH/FimT family pseudopilin n=1 Tax=Thalassotalea ponticola TaxID=1523392 RepID=UPI0025B5C67A|nr:GspH/FimT family pseudopilin [Thalassotalea ponticola]MDN3651701.1 GspH/FimT family pseudopilin [Thalassotalea ponticola]